MENPPNGHGNAQPQTINLIPLTPDSDIHLMGCGLSAQVLNGVVVLSVGLAVAKISPITGLNVKQIVLRPVATFSVEDVLERATQAFSPDVAVKPILVPV